MVEANQQVIPSEPGQAGQFRLQEQPAGAFPGIERNETENEITVTYANRFTLYDEEEKTPRAITQTKTIKTDKRVPKLGVMLVGLGGNNGTTFVSGLLANKGSMSWATRNG